MEDPTPMQLYLGCVHKRFEGKVDGVGPVVGVEYDVESFLASCVQRYLDLCVSDSARTGTPLKKSGKKKKVARDDVDEIDPALFLSVVPAPFLNEYDQR
eukprot:8681292-Lingulodinium_polyedra.AAC.1